MISTHNTPSNPDNPRVLRRTLHISLVALIFCVTLLVGLRLSSQRVGAFTYWVTATSLADSEFGNWIYNNEYYTDEKLLKLLVQQGQQVGLEIRGPLSESQQAFINQYFGLWGSFSLINYDPFYGDISLTLNPSSMTVDGIYNSFLNDEIPQPFQIFVSTVFANITLDIRIPDYQTQVRVMYCCQTIEIYGNTIDIMQIDAPVAPTSYGSYSYIRLHTDVNQLTLGSEDSPWQEGDSDFSELTLTTDHLVHELIYYSDMNSVWRINCLKDILGMKQVAIGFAGIAAKGTDVTGLIVDENRIQYANANIYPIYYDAQQFDFALHLYTSNENEAEKGEALLKVFYKDTAVGFREIRFSFSIYALPDVLTPMVDEASIRAIYVESRINLPPLVGNFDLITVTNGGQLELTGNCERIEISDSSSLTLSGQVQTLDCYGGNFTLRSGFVSDMSAALKNSTINNHGIIGNCELRSDSFWKSNNVANYDGGQILLGRYSDGDTTTLFSAPRPCTIIRDSVWKLSSPDSHPEETSAPDTVNPTTEAVSSETSTESETTSSVTIPEDHSPLIIILLCSTSVLLLASCLLLRLRQKQATR